MNYKTQVFTKQQLKDGLDGKIVLTSELKKEGEALWTVREGDKTHFELIREYHSGSRQIILCEEGELVQAVNEKGEKQNSASYSIGDVTKAHLHAEVPLLVRLEKIEEGGHVEGKLPLIEGNYNTYSKYVETEHWLKSWRLKRKSKSLEGF